MGTAPAFNRVTLSRRDGRKARNNRTDDRMWYQGKKMKYGEIRERVWGDVSYGISRLEGQMVFLRRRYV